MGKARLFMEIEVSTDESKPNASGLDLAHNAEMACFATACDIKKIVEAFGNKASVLNTRYEYKVGKELCLPAFGGK